MPLSSPTVRSKIEIIYGPDAVEKQISTNSTVDRPILSAHINDLGEVLLTVCQSHLLSDEEKNVFFTFRSLPDGPRLIFAHLIQCKPDIWHRLSSIKREIELGDSIISAIDGLCLPIASSSATNLGAGVKKEETLEFKDDVTRPAASKGKKTIKTEERVMSLSYHDAGRNKSLRPAHVIEPSIVKQEAVDPRLYNPFNLHTTNPVAGPSNVYVNAIPHLFNRPPQPDPGLTCFAHDNSSMSLRELLECLTADELKVLAKQIKIKTTQNRSSLISALLMTASTQTTLNFVPTPGKCKSKASKPKIEDCSGLQQTTLNFSAIIRGRERRPEAMPRIRSQEGRMREMVMKLLGKCVRINYDIFKLFRRAHIIYFRSTRYPSSVFPSSLLLPSKTRRYPEFTYVRDSGIWRNREALLMYEQALEVEAVVDGVLDGMGSRLSRGVGSRTPAAGLKFATPAIEQSLVTPKSIASSRTSKTPRGVNMNPGKEEDFEGELDSARVQEARMVRNIFEEVYPIWKGLVRTKEQAIAKFDGRTAGLERFEAGCVLTRVIHKGALALGVVKEYEYELEVLEALLAQKAWRRGQRGQWYERRAVILMTHIHEETDKEKIYIRAIEGVKEALMDDDTGIIYRPSLIRRLVRLEKILDIPPAERCISEGELRKAEEVVVEAIRVWNSAGCLKLDATGKVISDGRVRATTPMKSEQARQYFTPISARVVGGSVVDTPAQERNTKGSQVRKKQTGKSLWLGNDNAEVDVETRAMQHYGGLGFKGFHSESGVLTTIFALLFWDIIFADIPGAFEIPYQCAPLDLPEDTFYRPRKDLILQRLAEIEDGQARAILEKHDDEQREKNPWCVGVRWDICGKAELGEIVDCLGGKTVSIICHLFCQDYAGRAKGVPDLIVWNSEQSVCKFVEVKGPGDNMRENQKVWMDVLVRAGVPVEICKIVEPGQEPKKGRGKGKEKGTVTKTGKGRGKRKKSPVLSDIESEDAFNDQNDQLDGSDDSWNPHMDVDPQLGPRVQSRGMKRRVSDDELPLFAAPNSASPAKKRKTGGWISSP